MSFLNTETNTFSNISLRAWQLTQVFLPGESHGQRSPAGYSPWGHEESDTTERLPFHFSLSRIGEGNGNPLQCACLENPRDGGAWWAAIYGVTRSRTRLKRLSSSSSIVHGVVKSWKQLSDFHSHTFYGVDVTFYIFLYCVSIDKVLF